MRGVIKVATCQFAVGADVKRNAMMACRQIMQARKRGADVVHFPECALSGYAGTDIKEFAGYDWNLLREQTLNVCSMAKKAGEWVIVGSSHRLTKGRPRNCVYVINPRGEVVDRYDKRFCTQGDLKYFSPGDHFVTFDVKGVRCGLLICYDVRFPELYREYKKRGVQCMFHSFYNARAEKANIHTTIMPVTIQAQAASNYMWVSANNASGYYQSWASVMVQPDGRVAGRLNRHRAGLMVTKVDTNRVMYDASGPYRQRAMQGILNSGTVVKDARARDRKSL